MSFKRTVSLGLTDLDVLDTSCVAVHAEMSLTDVGRQIAEERRASPPTAPPVGSRTVCGIRLQDWCQNLRVDEGGSVSYDTDAVRGHTNRLDELQQEYATQKTIKHLESQGKTILNRTREANGSVKLSVSR